MSEEKIVTPLHTKLTIICVCGDERLEKVDAWRQTLRDHIAAGSDWRGTWELDTLIIYALNDSNVNIADVYADMWMMVTAGEGMPGEPTRTWTVQADRLTDALCAIYAAVCMDWDGTGEPWLS